MELQTQEEIGLFVFFGIYNIVLWPGLFFFILRRNLEPIKSRGFNLALIQVLLGEVLLLFAIIPNSVSCFFRPAAILLIVPFFCVPYAIRGGVLYHRYVLHNGMKLWAGRRISTSPSSVDSDVEMFLKNLSSHGSGSRGDSNNGTGKGSEHEEGSNRMERNRPAISKRRSSKEEVPFHSSSSSSDPSSPAPSTPEDPSTAGKAAAAGGASGVRNSLFPEEKRRQDFGLDLKLDKMFIWAVKSKKWFHDQFLIPLSLLISAPFVIIIILLYFFDDFIWEDEIRNDFTISVHNRCLTKGFVPYFFVQFAVAAPAISCVAYLLLGVREAFGVRFELTAVFICGSLATVGCLVSIFYPGIPPILNYAFFGCVGSTSFAFVTLIYPVIQSYKFQKVERKEKHPSDDEQKMEVAENSASSGGGARVHGNSLREKKRASRTSRSPEDDILKAIFDEPELLEAFEEFAVSTWCMENVLFYKKVQHFKTSAESKLVEQAKKIWTLHFERGCDFEVNVDAAVREKIMEMVMQHKFDREMFHEAEKIVFTMLRYNIYPLWKASSNFKTVLEKLGSPDVLTVRARRKNAPSKKLETI